MDGDRPSGVLLAVSVVLFWLAGVCFWVAFEGSGLLGQPMPAKGGGGVSYFKGALAGFAKTAQDLQAAGQQSQDQTAPGG